MSIALKIYSLGAAVRPDGDGREAADPAEPRPQGPGLRDPQPPRRHPRLRQKPPGKGEPRDDP